MVSVFNSELNGQGLIPGLTHCVVFFDKTSLHPGVYWVPANLMLGVTLRWSVKSLA